MDETSGRKKRVVVIGGGTGTHTVLSGLKRYQDELELTAVVTMADAGGSTGRLRDEFGYLPVGDVRMALTALAREEDEHEALVRQLFLHRFEKGEGLKGHNVGNLLLVALTDLLGSEEAAIRAAANVLGAAGAVIPVTTEPVHLAATYADGQTVVGEHLIDERTDDTPIVDLAVTPECSVNPQAAAAIAAADLVVLGPGDLYTSVLANCVVPGVREALQTTSARLVYVANLMTKRGQTSGLSSAEHEAVVEEYVGRSPAWVVVNTGTIDQTLQTRYAAEGEYPVVAVTHAPGVLAADLLARDEVVTQAGDTIQRSLVRHDPARVAELLRNLVTHTTPLPL